MKGDEDCLFLNIFVPGIQLSVKLDLFYHILRLPIIFHSILPFFACHGDIEYTTSTTPTTTIKKKKNEDVNTEQKLPVMLFIHGGGYSEGSGDDGLHGPDFLINEGVILVNVFSHNLFHM